MSDKVETLNVKGVELEVFQKKNIQIFNPRNHLLVEVDEYTLQFIRDYDASNEPEETLDQFLFSRKKRNLVDLKLLQFDFPTSNFTFLMKLLGSKWMKLLGILFIAVFVISVLFEGNKLITYYTLKDHFQPKNLLYILCAQLIIVLLHELGHVYAYLQNIKVTKIRMGFLIRYFCLPLFYSNVNFYRQLSKQAQLKIMVAGIKTQAFIGGILFLIMMFLKWDLFYYLYAVNILMILINCLPFLRLDGYWIINLLIGSENYMNNFLQFLSGKRQIKKSELLLGIINSLFILSVFSSGAVYMYLNLSK